MAMIDSFRLKGREYVVMYNHEPDDGQHAEPKSLFFARFATPMASNISCRSKIVVNWIRRLGFSSGDLKRQADCKGYAMNFEGCTLFTVDDGIEYSRLQQFNKSEISDNCLNSRVAWNAGFYYKKVTLADCMCLISNGGIFTTPHVTWPVGPVDPERLKVIVDAIWPVFAQQMAVSADVY